MDTICEIARSTSSKKIALFTHIGTKNLGDEATLTSLIQNIRQRDPEADLRAFVLYPADTRQRHGIPAFPLRSGMPAAPSVIAEGPGPQPDTGKEGAAAGLVARAKASLRRVPGLLWAWKAAGRCGSGFVGLFRETTFVLRSVPKLAGCDFLIVAGSGQLLDYLGGPWAFPYTCLKWTVLARLRRAQVIFLCVGASPFTSSLGKRFFRWALALASYRSFRDDTSRKLMESIGARGEMHVFPDMVWGLRLAESTPASRQSPLRTVGINPIPYGDPRLWTESDPAAYDRYVRNTAAFALWLLQNGYAVAFFPTQLRMDPPAIRDILQAMREGSPEELGDRVRVCPVQTLDDLVEQLTTVDVVVAARFHGVLISYLLNKPALAVCYHKKTEDLMRDVGQAEYALDIRCCDLPELTRRFIALEARSEEVKQEIGWMVAERRRALAGQFDRLFGPAEVPGGTEEPACAVGAGVAS
jgi:polysaccharide pyruvyl transferase WcaK-like protein